MFYFIFITISSKKQIYNFQKYLNSIHFNDFHSLQLVSTYIFPINNKKWEVVLLKILRNIYKIKILYRV